jgi:hypothetical protein
MNYDHDFGYYFTFFSFLLKKREEGKENELEKSWSNFMPSRPVSDGLIL